MASDTSHRLDPLLRPRSIAIVGAKAQSGTSGNNVLRSCLGGDFSGSVFLVNPSSDEIDGHPCYPSLRDVPEKIDAAALVVGNNRIEQAFRDAVEVGVRAAVIYGSCVVEEDVKEGHPSLRQRIRNLALDNNIEVCGINCAGFMNRDADVSLQLQNIGDRDGGSVCLLSQSGSMYAALVHNGGRLKYNLSVSTGQEMVTDLVDYMDYALEMESTRTIGLFIETVRNPVAFIGALEKAVERDIAVVALKVARTEQSKRFAMSHSGAIAGDDSGFDAVFRKYGVLRANDPDELMATLQLLDCGKRAGLGGLVAIADSGGERELLTDTASDAGVLLTEISETTRSQLAHEVEYGVDVENPLDAWNSGFDYARVFRNSMRILMEDPGAAAGLWIADLHDDLSHYWQYAEAAKSIAPRLETPLAFVTCYAKTENTRLVHALAEANIPVLEGIRPALRAVRGMMDRRDFRGRCPDKSPVSDRKIMDSAVQWRERLQDPAPLSFLDSLSMLEDFGIPVVTSRLAGSKCEAIAEAHEIGFPVALKTAIDSIEHKSDVGGVYLDITDEAALSHAYDSLDSTLGSPALVSSMAPKGHELAFGLVHDEVFGPLVMVAAGGVYIEQFRDAAFALPPFDAANAELLIHTLSIGPVLQGVRGSAPINMAKLAQALSKFSFLVSTLGDDIRELDINPIIAGQDGAIAVDVLIHTKGRSQHD